jgi:hypothetical protein
LQIPAFLCDFCAQSISRFKGLQANSLRKPNKEFFEFEQGIESRDQGIFSVEEGIRRPRSGIMFAISLLNLSLDMILQPMIANVCLFFAIELLLASNLLPSDSIPKTDRNLLCRLIALNG